MEDEGYVQTLLEILTNPNPSGIDPSDPYGRADDGIDRFSGFGREVWVESLRVADGEHGPELEVSFGLAIPPGPVLRVIPSRGVVRVPFERRWRKLSGYEDPADYAPKVAQQVQSAAHQHIERHRSGDQSAIRERTRAALPTRDVQWQMLLDGLGTEGSVVEVSPGRVKVRMGADDDEGDSEGDVITVVVTPDQWEDVLVDHGGDLYFADLLGPLWDDDVHFVVFYNGDLVRSTREERPPVRGTAFARRTAEMQARNPDGQFYWSAFPPGVTPDPDPLPRKAGGLPDALSTAEE